jgi:hypothetical protein
MTQPCVGLIFKLNNYTHVYHDVLLQVNAISKLLGKSNTTIIINNFN